MSVILRYYLRVLFLLQVIVECVLWARSQLPVALWVGIKGRKKSKILPQASNAIKPIHRSEGVWFRQWTLFQGGKKLCFCQSEIPMMMVAISNVSDAKWVNYNLMDVTFYNHWQDRFIRLCQKTHPFLLSERFIAAKQRLLSRQFCSSRRKVFSEKAFENLLFTWGFNEVKTKC